MTRLSTVDASFLLGEHKCTPLHVGGVDLFSFPEGAKEDWLHQTLLATDAYTGEVSRPFNLKIADSRFGLGLPRWVEDADLDLDYHVRHSALPKPGRYREMFALVSRLHSTRLHRDRPLWEAHIIEGVEDNRFALYFKVHHSLIDGVGAMRMFQASLSEDPSKRDMPPLWAVPRPPRLQSSHGDAQVALDSIGEQLKSRFDLLSGAGRGIKLYLDGLMEGDVHGMRGPFQAPSTMINERVSASRRFVAQSYSLSRIRSVGKALDATINDIVLAMSAGALRSYLLDQGGLPKAPLTAMAPINIRPADGPDMGNEISAIIVSLATDIEDPAKRLRAIQHSTKAGKAVVGSMTRAQIPIYTQLISMPTFLTLLLNIAGHVRPAFNVTVSNVPGPRNRLYWNGARLEGMYPVSIVTDGMAINITVTSYGDSLDFGIVACRRSVPGAQRLIDHLETALVELETAAGFKDQPLSAASPQP